MSAGPKLEEAEKAARRGTSALTFMIIKKRAPRQTVQEALSGLEEACSIIRPLLPPVRDSVTVETSTQGDRDNGSTD